MTREEKRREYNRQWRKQHKEEIAAYNKQYKQEHKAKILKKNKEYQQAHRKERQKYNHEYWLLHKTEIQERKKQKPEQAKRYNHTYTSTKNGRASRLYFNYQRNDTEYNRGDCTITKDWIVERIFGSSCVYCGDSDWKHLGCDRIVNDKPHTPENCICACGICNIERQLKSMSVEEFIEYRKTHPRDCDKNKEGV